MDYCTLWFEGWWSQCCEAHDVGYAAGEVSRSVLDQTLAMCVANTAPSGWAVLGAGVGALMYVGVRLGGWYFYKR